MAVNNGIVTIAVCTTRHKNEYRVVGMHVLWRCHSFLLFLTLYYRTQALLPTQSLNQHLYPSAKAQGQIQASEKSACLLQLLPAISQPFIYYPCLTKPSHPRIVYFILTYIRTLLTWDSMACRKGCKFKENKAKGEEEKCKDLKWKTMKREDNCVIARRFLVQLLQLAY